MLVPIFRPKIAGKTKKALQIKSLSVPKPL